MSDVLLTILGGALAGLTGWGVSWWTLKQERQSAAAQEAQRVDQVQRDAFRSALAEIETAIVHLSSSLEQSRHPTIIARESIAMALRYLYSVPADVGASILSVATAIDRYNTIAGVRLHERALTDSQSGDGISLDQASGRFVRSATMMQLSSDTAGLLIGARKVIGSYLRLDLPPIESVDSELAQ